MDYPRSLMIGRGLRFSEMSPMLEVILQNLSGDRRMHLYTFSIPAAGADDFSPANNFSRGQAGNFRRQHQTDFEL